MSFTQEMLDIIQQRNIILAVHARSSANLLESKIEVKVTEIRLINEQVWLARMDGDKDLWIHLGCSKQRKTNKIRKYECLLESPVYIMYFGLFFFPRPPFSFIMGSIFLPNNQTWPITKQVWMASNWPKLVLQNLNPPSYYSWNMTCNQTYPDSSQSNINKKCGGGIENSFNRNLSILWPLSTLINCHLQLFLYTKYPGTHIYLKSKLCITTKISQILTSNTTIYHCLGFFRNITLLTSAA